ncbi:hypothetical protein BHE97_13385 [Aeromicrobium sp. PE09-221]|uniref:glycerophosphodiester phosphodiesterase n=1 Tax=Aeromicrobium sp. PE09-221 TaxID=1898043 RepID=UPI000B3EB018|nr:glycerophosphodiester phosphodiesterase family protein [Aeromicrobium sp. PE09-221]OUZ08656.1 hypothetical protein BHE97_13385 [Aeromicrobium sp. PE09-221]
MTTEPTEGTITGIVDGTRRVRVNGHRGQSFTAPENTLPAMLDAATLGADGIEFDVHMTADGHVVGLHDQTLRRTTDVERVFPHRVEDPVWSFTASEIARLDAGAWKGPLWAGTPLPFIADILKAFRDRPQALCIELKATPVDPVHLAGVLAATVGRRPKVTFLSFQRPLIDAVRRAIPGARTALAAVRRPSTADLESYDEFHLDATLLTSRVIDRIHDRGKTVTAWTVDSPHIARRLAGMGVDAITTNRVDIIRRELDATK